MKKIYKLLVGYYFENDYNECFTYVSAKSKDEAVLKAVSNMSKNGRSKVKVLKCTVDKQRTNNAVLRSYSEKVEIRPCFRIF